MKLCSIEGCGKKHKAKGFCDMHYQVFRAHGDPEYKRPILKCSLPGCGKTHEAKEFCKAHYDKLKNHGDPDYVAPPFIDPGCKIPGCVKKHYSKGFCTLHYHRDLYRTDPNRRQSGKNTAIKRKYGLLPEAWQELLVRQGGVCAICKQPESKNKQLSVDHDHRTNKVRGLLCSFCNPGLGMFKDSIVTLSEAIEYLKRSDSGTQ